VDAPVLPNMLFLSLLDLRTSWLRCYRAATWRIKSLRRSSRFVR